MFYIDFEYKIKCVNEFFKEYAEGFSRVVYNA